MKIIRGGGVCWAGIMRAKWEGLRQYENNIEDKKEEITRDRWRGGKGRWDNRRYTWKLDDKECWIAGKNGRGVVSLVAVQVLCNAF